MSPTTDDHPVEYPPPPGSALAPTFGAPPPRARPTVPQLSMPKLGWLVVAGVLVDLALRSGVASLSSTLAAVVVVGPLLGREFRRNRPATTLASAALVFAAWLPLRASDWLTGLNAVAVLTCLAAAAAVTRAVPLTLSMKTVSVVVTRLLNARFFGAVVASALNPLRSVRARQAIPIIRGVAIAIVPVVVLAALLASADAVFAESIDIDVAPAGFFEHAFLILFAVLALAGLIAITSEPIDESFSDRRPLGTTEAMVLLVSVGVLYGAFAVVQLIGAFGRADDLLAEQGLTYAEYARSGFFQLLWVAGLTVVLLGVVRLLVRQEPPRLDAAVRVAGAVVAALTILIVVTAIVRLRLYTDEFGQTTLRWYSTAFAWMLGAVFIALAAGHHRRAENLLVPALFGIAALTLFAVNVLNPEARVAAHNLSRADAVESLDAEYVTRLSADAWPKLLDNKGLIADRSPGGEPAVSAACADASAPNGYGLFGFNLARARLDCASP